jgi:uncharacterized protein YgbK (DUF1537 family)
MEKVSLVPHEIIRQGNQFIKKSLLELKKQNNRFAIIDAIFDNDLIEIGKAILDMPLTTGASGIAYGLAQVLSTQKKSRIDTAKSFTPPQGFSAVIAGSCSKATLGQIRHFQQNHPTYYVNVTDIAAGKNVVEDVVQWAQTHMKNQHVLIYSSVPKDQLSEIQNNIGIEKASQLTESAVADISKRLIHFGVRKLIVAGGETSGAVVKRLQIDALRIGPEIDPGVPWTLTQSDPPIALALKSGNFGTENFFEKALEMLV